MRHLEKQVAPDGPRVMFVSTGLAKGGAETQLVRLASNLRQRGWRVCVVSLNGTCSFEEQLDSIKADFFPLKLHAPLRFGNIVGSLRLAIRLVGSWKPDIIVSFMYHANLAGSLLKLITGLPLVSSIRNESFGAFWREKLAFLGHRIDSRITVNSRRAAQALTGKGILPPGKTVIISNSIEAGPPRSVETFSQGPTMRWLAIGRLSPQKDYLNLLQAFRLLLEERPESKLSIAGDGPLKGEVEMAVARLSLADRVTMLGHRNDVLELLQQSDALVLSSATEGMPNVIMEAMACGLPVVATDVGGVSDLVVNGRNGFVAQARDPIALASAMIRLANSSTIERHRMGEHGRRLICEQFSVDRICDNWEDLLLDVMREHGRKKRMIHA